VNGDRQSRITVALADDHTLFREGVRGMLLTDPSITVVGEASDGYAAAELAMEHHPDILLLDVEMPGPGAAAVLATVSENCPGVHIIVLTMHDDADMVQKLVNCGATAYLVKNILRDELIAAIHSTVSRPDSELVSVSRHTMESMDRNRQAKGKSLLTLRETEVLKLTAEACSNAQIAARLKITEATVKRHLTNIYAKLNAVSRVDAIRKGTEAKLLGPGFA
jgi:DNA-binding NarL/FixJ family response regulator